MPKKDFEYDMNFVGDSMRNTSRNIDDVLSKLHTRLENSSNEEEKSFLLDIMNDLVHTASKNEAAQEILYENIGLSNFVGQIKRQTQVRRNSFQQDIINSTHKANKSKNQQELEELFNKI